MSNFTSFLKSKALLLVMTVALAGAITAIIILSMMLGKAGGKTRALKIENSQLASQVTNLSAASRTGEKVDDQEFFRRDFVSHKDGIPDSYLLIPPKQQPHSNKYTLIVYLHGMGSNYLEPYVVAKKDPDRTINKRSLSQCGDCFFELQKKQRLGKRPCPCRHQPEHNRDQLCLSPRFNSDHWHQYGWQRRLELSCGGTGFDKK